MPRQAALKGRKPPSAVGIFNPHGRFRLSAGPELGNDEHQEFIDFLLLGFHLAALIFPVTNLTDDAIVGQNPSQSNDLVPGWFPPEASRARVSSSSLEMMLTTCCGF